MVSLILVEIEAEMREWKVYKILLKRFNFFLEIVIGILALNDIV